MRLKRIDRRMRLKYVTARGVSQTVCIHSKHQHRSFLYFLPLDVVCGCRFKDFLGKEYNKGIILSLNQNLYFLFLS